MSIVNPNPALSSGFKHAGTAPDRMTLQGAVQKSALLIMTTIGSAVASVAAGLPTELLSFAAILGFVVAMFTVFKPHIARYTAAPYALLEGVVAGLISKWYADSYGGGIVVYAAGITAAIFVALLGLYSSKLIRATENFKLAVAAATIGIGLYYLVALLVGLFGLQLPLIASNSLFGIGFSLFVVVIASANLVIDFDFIEEGERQGAPAHMEWYAAFGLLVTLVWLYLEVLRLLAKINSRD